MDKSIAIVGGDKRNFYLCRMFEDDNYNVDYITEYDQLSRIEDAKTIIGPIPFSKDGENVYVEKSKSKIPIVSLLRRCHGKKLIAGAVSKDVLTLAENNNVDVVDLMNDEALAVFNTIATAEGSLEVAMRRTERVVHGSNVLILGFGRVGRVTAHEFAGALSNVYCAARKAEAFAWIEACGYKAIDINNMDDDLGKFDIVVNTPPTMILNRERLMKLKDGCLVIDLASNPGGVDREAVNELGINFEWALALPGKVAPITAAEHIKKCLLNL